MAVDEIEMAAPTAVGVESGAQNVRSHEEDFALSGRRVDGGSRLAVAISAESKIWYVAGAQVAVPSRPFGARGRTSPVGQVA